MILQTECPQCHATYDLALPDDSECEAEALAGHCLCPACATEAERFLLARVREDE